MIMASYIKYLNTPPSIEAVKMLSNDFKDVSFLVNKDSGKPYILSIPITETQGVVAIGMAIDEVLR